MRALGLRVLVGAIGLGVVASAATALSIRPPTTSNQTLTLAGGPNARSIDAGDPDAPIATARYGDAVEGTAADLSEESARATALADTATLSAMPVPAPQPPQTLSSSTFPSRLLTAERPRRQPRLALARPAFSQDRLAAFETVESLAFTPTSQQTTFRRLSVNASGLLSKMGTTADDARRGRWMLFAASSGKALGLNVVRDPVAGWRSAGWSQERLARFGTHQIGLGWRKDNKQLSLSATRRKLSVQDISKKDVVFGFSLSVKTR